MKLFFGLLAISAVTSGAAPFNPKDVGVDPAVVAHIDCDALRGSSIGQTILSDPEAQQKLSALAAIFSFDVRTQLHGLTVYTTEDHPKDGALIVYADFDPSRLIAIARAANGASSETNGARVIYSWIDDKRKAKEGGEPRVYAAIDGNRVVFGQEELHLAQALNIIDGKGPNYSAKNEMPQANGAESIIAEGVLRKFEFNSADPNAAILKMARSVRLKIGEGKDSMNASLRLEAADPATASQMSAIVQGLIAFLKLQRSDENALKLADAIKIGQDGAAVTLAMTAPSSDVVNMIKEGQKKAAEKKAKAEESDHSGGNK